MSPNENAPLDALLVEVLKKPKDEREEYLDLLCRNDDHLHRELQSLLVASDEAADFLERPAVRGDETALTPIHETPGTMIGRYKLLQRIGEGGFGVVYMAEQTVPVRRKVALKMIKVGMDTRQVIARFEAERQALALMDHPNIAKVLDAGATETGRPYFVMDLVRGVPVTEYCDQNRLSMAERLGLFLQVCRGVQHAHQKGIIHRDLKPNNVLVTLRDATPVPKIIDFGIAKATQQRLTEKTLFTEFKQFVGTPAYMSPEQAQMNELDIDTRTDIYSLGVLLYELLTGTTPFDTRTLREAALGEIQRIIAEVDPPRPSTRLSTMADQLTDVARRRHTEPASLGKLLRGDLDWIVMRCLEKDRTRRYDTATDLARDIERHLQHEPVLASPPGALYKLTKFTRRNRVAVTAGSLVAGAILLGLALSTIGFVQASRDRQRARAGEAIAAREAAKAEAVNRFLQEMLASVDPSVAEGRDVSVRSILDNAGDKLNAGELAQQPQVEAAIHTTIGNTYRALGIFPSAESHLRRAWELTRRTHGQGSIQEADSLHALGHAVLLNFEPLRAEPFLRKALAIRKQQLGNSHPNVADTLSVLGTCMHCEGRPDEAEPLYRKALEIRRNVYGSEHPDVARSLRDVAGVLHEKGDFAAAEALWTEGKAIEARLGRHDPESIARHLRAQGHALSRKGDYAAAEERYRESLALFRKQFGEVHPEVANGMSVLGSLYFRSGDHDAAEVESRRALAMRQQVYGNEHLLVMGEMKNLIKVLRAKGDSQGASSVLLEVLGMVPVLLGGHHPLAETLENLLSVLEDREDAALAELVYRQALASDRRRLGEDHPLLAQSLSNLAVLLERQEKHAAAEPLLREALALRTRLLGNTHPDTRESMSNLAYVLRAQQKYDEAEAIWHELIRVDRLELGNDHLSTVQNLRDLAEFYVHIGKYEEAEPHLLEVCTWIEQHPDKTPGPFRNHVLELLELTYDATGQADDVAIWRERLGRSGDD